VRIAKVLNQVSFYLESFVTVLANMDLAGHSMLLKMVSLGAREEPKCLKAEETLKLIAVKLCNHGSFSCPRRAR
jgi:hypothetical protein